MKRKYWPADAPAAGRRVVGCVPWRPRRANATPRARAQSTLVHIARKVEDQYLGLSAHIDGQLRGVGDLYGVAGAPRGPVGIQSAACHMNVDPAARPNGQGCAL